MSERVGQILRNLKDQYRSAQEERIKQQITNGIFTLLGASGYTSGDTYSIISLQGVQSEGKSFVELKVALTGDEKKCLT